MASHRRKGRSVHVAAIASRCVAAVQRHARDQADQVRRSQNAQQDPYREHGCRRKQPNLPELTRACLVPARESGEGKPDRE